MVGGHPQGVANPMVVGIQVGAFRMERLDQGDHQMAHLDRQDRQLEFQNLKISNKMRTSKITVSHVKLKIYSGEPNTQQVWYSNT